MGLISDILESNRERIGQIEMSSQLPIVAPAAAPPQVACPVCDRAFGSDLALNNHITRDHAQTHVYVKANGRVVRSIDIFAEKVHACDLILVGARELSVTIRAGSLCKHLDITASRDLLPFIPRDYVGELELVVAQRPHDRFVMFFGTEPPFDTQQLNSEVIGLQHCLESGVEPAWDSYRRRQHELARNGLEKNYLDAFFEYSLGFQLEKQERLRESASHLERAMHLLHPYATTLARTAQRVLAIRMNCFSPSFSPLNGCHRASDFYLAHAFFVANLVDLPSGTGRSPSARSQDCLYIDGFTERLLLALKAFYARDFVNLCEPLEHLDGHPLAADTNNEHKLLLLKARTARVRGDHNGARRIYQTLLYHPAFGAEAEAFAN